MRLIFLGFLVLCLMLGGCRTMVVMAEPSPATADMSDDTLELQTTTIATPLTLPLYFVIKDEQFPKEIDVESSSYKVLNYKPFFEDGLRKMLTPYFKEIAFVAHANKIPEGIAHYHAEVNFTGIKGDRLDYGRAIHIILMMGMSLDVSFRKHPSGAQFKAFSYKGEGSSKLSYETLDVGIKDMTEAALNGLSSSWVKEKVYQNLQSIELGKPKPDKVRVETSTSAPL